MQLRSPVSLNIQVEYDKILKSLEEIKSKFQLWRTKNSNETCQEVRNYPFGKVLKEVSNYINIVLGYNIAQNSDKMYLHFSRAINDYANLTAYRHTLENIESYLDQLVLSLASDTVKAQASYDQSFLSGILAPQKELLERVTALEKALREYEKTPSTHPKRAFLS